MFYKKPDDVTYTQMAIYIDNHVYTDDCDDELVFQYLYHLANMLAHKKNFFNKVDYYDEFAIYFATNMFVRLRHPSPNMEKVKSVLNYMKSISYPRKVDFEQETYSKRILEYEINKDEIVPEESFANKLSETVDELMRVEFSLCLEELPNTVFKFLKRIPYVTDRVVWNNIYISCMLSLINSFTLPKEKIEKYGRLTLKENSKIKLLHRWYTEETQNCTILYHLDENMYDYITILVREIRHELSKDLSSLLHTYIPTQSGLEALAFAELDLTTNVYEEV